MRDNTYQTLELNRASAEQAPNQVFKNIIKTQENIEKARVDYFARPKSNGGILKSLNFFKPPTFLEQHRPPKNESDLINLESEIGGTLFEVALPDFPHKKFFLLGGKLVFIYK